MSITYPEAQPSVASKKPANAAIMNSGSALFPNGATRVYERAGKARSGKSNLMMWIAAPVAVVVVGGAVLLSTGRHTAAPAKSPAIASTTSTTTTATPTPATATPAPAETQPAPVAKITHVTRSETVRTAAPVQRSAQAPRVTHRAASVSTTTSNAAPAAVAAAPAPAPTAPTPGTFAYTPPAASAVTTTPETITPSSAPAPAPSTSAQPAPQASNQA